MLLYRVGVCVYDGTGGILFDFVLFASPAHSRWVWQCIQCLKECTWDFLTWQRWNLSCNIF